MCASVLSRVRPHVVCECVCVCVCMQCYLKIGEKDPEGIESKEARKAFMKANMDAGCSLDSLCY